MQKRHDRRAQKSSDWGSILSRPRSLVEMWEVALIELIIAAFPVFAQIHTSEVSCPPLERRNRSNYSHWQGSVSLVVVGDLMMGGSALPVLHQRGSDYPFDLTRTHLRTADIALANLEAPFTHSGKAFEKTFIFRIPPEYAGGVARAGFDVLTLANNHILDYGPEGLLSTVMVLDSLGIAHCGAGPDLLAAEKGVVVKRGLWRIGFLAYSLTYPTDFWATLGKMGTAYPYPDRFKECLRMMREEADLIVVSFHWGGELKTEPKPYQRLFAYRAIDWGADLVVGHHPHVLQGLEIYKDRLIAYSLGNFVFGSYSRNARESIILKVRYDQMGFLMAEVIPISVFNYEVQFQPRLLEGALREKVIQRLNGISIDLNGGRKIIRESGVIVNE